MTTTYRQIVRRLSRTLSCATAPRRRARARLLLAAVAVLAYTSLPLASASADAPASGADAAGMAEPRLPVLVDGRLYPPNELSRFKGTRLYFVAGRRERHRGHAVAFTKRRDWVAYLRRDARAAPRARAAGVGEARFYEHAFLQGDSFTLQYGESDPNLRYRCRGWFCSGNWDNRISSVRTSDVGVELFADTWFPEDGWMVYVRPFDSAELSQIGFNDVASSVCNPSFPTYTC